MHLAHSTLGHDAFDGVTLARNLYESTAIYTFTPVCREHNRVLMCKSTRVGLTRATSASLLAPHATPYSRLTHWLTVVVLRTVIDVEYCFEIISHKE